MRSVIGVSFESDRGHTDLWAQGKLLFEAVILRFAVSKSQPPGCRSIAAHRDKGNASFRPQRGDNVRCSRTPIESGKNCYFDFQRIYERDHVESHRRGLPVSHALAREKTRRAITSQVGNKD